MKRGHLPFVEDVNLCVTYVFNFLLESAISFLKDKKIQYLNICLNSGAVWAVFPPTVGLHTQNLPGVRRRDRIQPRRASCSLSPACLQQNLCIHERREHQRSCTTRPLSCPSKTERLGTRVKGTQVVNIQTCTFIQKGKRTFFSKMQWFILLLTDKHSKDFWSGESGSRLQTF